MIICDDCLIKDGLEEETGPCVRDGGEPKLRADSEHTGNSILPPFKEENK